MWVCFLKLLVSEPVLFSIVHIYALLSVTEESFAVALPELQSIL